MADPTSHAILMGTSVYTAGFGSEPLPAAAGGLTAMRAALQGPGGWHPSQITEIRDRSSDHSVFREVVESIHGTTGVLIFYYVGHAQPLPGDDLGLAWTDTSDDSRRRLATSLSLNELREEMRHNCPARTIIVILDCDCSGIATRSPRNRPAAPALQSAIPAGTGTYIWTACGHNEDAPRESTPDGLPYFTRFLVETVFDGIIDAAAYLTVTDIHRRIADRYSHIPLPVAPVPRLEYRGTPPDTFAFTRNPAYVAPLPDPVPVDGHRRLIAAAAAVAVLVAAVVGIAVLRADRHTARRPTSLVPGTQLLLPFSGLNFPMRVAVDTGGNVYVADAGNNRVLQLPAGSSAQITLPITATPQSIAVDAAGDVFVADGKHDRVLRLAAGALATTTLPITGTPTSVAVDAAGDVYVLDIASETVLRLAAGASAPSTVPFPHLTNPVAVAADPAGDVYVLDTGGAWTDTAGHSHFATPDANRVLRLAAGSSTPTTLPFTGDAAPSSTFVLAVDAVGGVYVEDRAGNGIRRLTAGASTSTVLPATFAGDSIAVDATGADIYVVEHYSKDVWQLAIKH
ncbi:NHL repeat-containing protein [Nocardia sp. BMG111209]|uniref:NHL repeat-containing protein n=1 Tax=Nocardia sp. BMG111209 TaxID=1160137 RepID=UPI00036F3ACC|nr:NHL repeat-containing protein [Nocardia sp. BMG111209]